ncbi:MAG: hypothetical protein SF066_12195, partial [Thermoanaerobaculia bacterium]|nr:hypothetical protein [Thermoanaerobaculia bacterium]
MLPIALTLLVLTASPPELDLNHVLAAARPSVLRLAVEAEWAAAARELAATRGRRLDAPILTLETGPRFAPGGDDVDLALGIEAPLATDL